MGYAKPISAQMKVEVLHRIWAGEKLARVARECGISRQVIYTWKRKADYAVFQALREKKRGPKVNRRYRAGLDERALENVSPGRHDYQVAESHLDLLKEGGNCQSEQRPERCPVCGCEKIYKNGTYSVKDRSSTRKQQRRKIQRYICVWCKSSICVH